MKIPKEDRQLYGRQAAISHGMSTGQVDSRRDPNGPIDKIIQDTIVSLLYYAEQEGIPANQIVIDALHSFQSETKTNETPTTHDVEARKHAANLAAIALTAYEDEKYPNTNPPHPPNTVRELITDLLHLLNLTDYCVYEAMDRAMDHFTAEIDPNHIMDTINEG